MYIRSLNYVLAICCFQRSHACSHFIRKNCMNGGMCYAGQRYLEQSDIVKHLQMSCFKGYLYIYLFLLII